MEQWGVPDFYELLLVTNEANLKDRRDVVERFARAFRRGFEAALADPQGSIDTLLELNPGTVNEAVERKGVELLVPMWKAEAPEFGWQEASRWNAFAAWMKGEGFIRETLDPSQAYTNEFTKR
jgi:putative hydroxymethylpyrimidine transport system substrate-binding protein